MPPEGVRSAVPPGDENWGEAGERLYASGLAWKRAAARAIEEMPLTMGDYRVLRGLQRLEEQRTRGSFSNVEIALEAGVDEQTAFRQLARLWKLGFVSRAADECQWLNSMTDDAVAILAVAAPLVEEASRRFFGALEDEQREVIRSLPGAERWRRRRARRPRWWDRPS